MLNIERMVGVVGLHILLYTPFLNGVGGISPPCFNSFFSFPL
jgi:hypothetical protein